MPSNWKDCDYCDGKGFSVWEHPLTEVKSDLDCRWCQSTGQVPDGLANQKEASREVAQALGDLVLWPNPQNTEALALALRVFARSMDYSIKDPWNDDEIQFKRRDEE